MNLVPLKTTQGPYYTEFSGFLRVFYGGSWGTVCDDEFCDNVRKRLKLTKSQLPNQKIKKVCRLNGKLISDWLVNNADGFEIRDAGRLIVSKWMPKCLRGDKDEKIEEILNNPRNDQYMKDMFTKRYKKSIDFYKKRGKQESGYHVNPHSFFYLFRVMWFNRRNCKFDKAPLYDFEADRELREKLNEKIIQGKEYFEWHFSDFFTRKRRKNVA